MLSLYPSWETEVIPMADGGEGTVEAMAAAAGGKAVVDPVTGPLGWPVQARSLRLPGDVAVMEMAEASGLLLVPEEKRNPLITSTFGTGEMIDRALARGDRHIYIGIGGSATCDGGMGAMEALGVRFLDRNGRKLPGQGASLGRVETIDLSCLHEGVEDMDLTILSDVTNPLWGERGAARAFGPQKGADPVMVENWRPVWFITGGCWKTHSAWMWSIFPAAVRLAAWGRRCSSSSMAPWLPARKDTGTVPFR